MANGDILYGFWRNLWGLPPPVAEKAPVVRLHPDDRRAIVTRELAPTQFEEMPKRSIPREVGTARPTGTPITPIPFLALANPAMGVYQILPEPAQDESYVIDAVILVSHCTGAPNPQTARLTSAPTGLLAPFAPVYWFFGLDVGNLVEPQLWQPREPFPLAKGLGLYVWLTGAHTGFVHLLTRYWLVKGQG